MLAVGLRIFDNGQSVLHAEDVTNSAKDNAGTEEITKLSAAIICGNQMLWSCKQCDYTQEKQSYNCQLL